MSDSTRDFVARRMGIAPEVVDRLAAAWGLATGGAEGVDAPAHPSVDAFPDGPVLSELLRARGEVAPQEVLTRAVGAGRVWLAELVDSHPDDPHGLLAAVLGALTDGPRTSGAALDVPVGTRNGAPVRWAFDLESGQQTNANARITGLPGVGKSQFLMHLLAAVATRAPGMGFVLLDYKGDLSREDAFVRATNATVLQPERAPVPINPFDLPEGLKQSLVASTVAETLGSLDPNIGNVQKALLRRAVAMAYEMDSHASSADIARAVRTTYEAERRAPDSVTGWLEQLAELDLFATRSELSTEAFLGDRWILDLSGLQSLRDLVASVMLGWLARHIPSLADSQLRGGGRRQLRAVVSIDEAHHYIQRKCQPLLELVRVGRSKGVPVVLSSQSLTDFKRVTELEEFLPNNFVLRHGIAPDARDLQGALRLPRDAARRASDQTTMLDQFHALTSLPGVEGELRLHAFFEQRYRD